MNKKLQTLLIVIGVLAVMFFAFFAGNKKTIKNITMEDYNKIVEQGGYVYYGNVKDEEVIENASETLNKKINVLSATKEVKDLKEGTLYKYEDGKEVFKYSDDLNSYKFKQSLMKENLIDKSYITVTFDEYKEIYKSSGYNFMFIGSETCGYCTMFKEVINEVLKDHYFNVYYIDLSTVTQDEYNALVATDSYMSENEWGTPLNLLYKDGKRINVLNGYKPAEELVKFLKDNKVI